MTNTHVPPTWAERVDASNQPTNRDQLAVAVKLIVLLMAPAAAENGMLSLKVYGVLPYVPAEVNVAGVVLSEVVASSHVLVLSAFCSCAVSV